MRPKVLFFCKLRKKLIPQKKIAIIEEFSKFYYEIIIKFIKEFFLIKKEQYILHACNILKLNLWIKYLILKN